MKQNINKRDKATWVKALRSGEYEQGTGYLCKDNRFCCLGVAYDVLIDGYWSLGFDDAWAAGDNCYTFLPEGARQQIGLGAGHQFKLVEMNDNRKSFNEISDWIEANL